MQKNLTKSFSTCLVSLIFMGSVNLASANTAEDMSELVGAWVGQSEETLLNVWGESRRLTSESGNTLHVYSARSRCGGGFGVSGSIGSVPVGGRTAGSGRADDLDATMRACGGCDVSFETRGGVVIDATWSTEGSPDRSKARRTCWREFRRNEAE